VRLTVLGSSPSWPNPGEAQSGFLVEAGQTRLLLDCGNGVLSRVRLLAGAPPAAVVLSHMHPDHIADVVPLLFGKAIGPLRWPTVVYAPPGGRVVLAELVEVFGWRLSWFEETTAVHEYRTTEPLVVGDATLRFVRTRHSPHSYLVRVEHDGAALVYSGDTAPTPALAEHARGCALLLCEASSADAPPDGAERAHLSAGEAAEAALAACAERLVLTHVPAEARADVLARARPIFAETELALPGAVFEVGLGR